MIIKVMQMISRKIKATICAIAASLSMYSSHAQDFKGQVSETYLSQRMSGSGKKLSHDPVVVSTARLGYDDWNLTVVAYNDLGVDRGPKGVHPNEYRTFLGKTVRLPYGFSLKGEGGLYFYPDNFMGNDSDKAIELAANYTAGSSVRSSTEVSVIHFFPAGGNEQVDRLTLTERLAVLLFERNGLLGILHAGAEGVWQDLHMNDKYHDSIEGWYRFLYTAGFEAKYNGVSMTFNKHWQVGNDNRGREDTSFWSIGVKFEF
jgi:hypothetical protein